MRIIFIVLLSLNCCCLLAQTNESGTISGDTLRLYNGAVFIIGEKLQLGTGSNGSKGFEHIYMNSVWAGKSKLNSGWSHKTMVIKKFKEEGTKKTGKKIMIVLGAGDIQNYQCDVVSAIEQGEVIAKGVVSGQSSQNGSVADELSKLKKLYDDGILTKDEYEAQKEKASG